MKTNCNITGIEFEATSKRQKNHPSVSELMNDLNRAKDGRYSIIKSALISKTGTFKNFEEVEYFVNNFITTSKKEEALPEDTTTCIDYV